LAQKSSRHGLRGMLTLRVWYSRCQFVVFNLFVIRIFSTELSGYNQLSDAKETYFAFA
jgi:hypothetical protein